MRKVVLGLSVVLAVLLLMVPPVSAVDENEPTSLEICEEVGPIDFFIENGMWLFHGEIDFFTTNIGEHPAYIDYWTFTAEAKWKKQDWTTMGGFSEYLSFPLAPGDTLEIGVKYLGAPIYTFKAFRFVLGIHLTNHPTGDHWFRCKASFEVPEGLLDG